VYQTIFDIIAEAVVKSIEESLVVPSNVSLKAAKLGGIGRYRAGLAEGIHFSGYRLNDIRVSVHSGERLGVLLEGREFDGYD